MNTSDHIKDSLIEKCLDYQACILEIQDVIKEEQSRAIPSDSIEYKISLMSLQEYTYTFETLQKAYNYYSERLGKLIREIIHLNACYNAKLTPKISEL